MDKANEESLNQEDEESLSQKSESQDQKQESESFTSLDHEKEDNFEEIIDFEDESEGQEGFFENIDLEKSVPHLDPFIDPETAQKIDELKVQMESLDDDIRSIMGKYKITMWILVACIVVYLLFLFVIRQSWSTYVVLATCVVMIFLAVLNTKYSKKIQQLATKRKLIRQQLEKLTPNDKKANEEVKEAIEEEAIIANATSLNDLPKQYTVLDEVKLPNGEMVKHIVVSPYGLAVVGSPEVQKEIEEILDQLHLTAPIFFYDPDTEISTLVENIQMEKQVALDEVQIMTLLRTFVGL